MAESESPFKCSIEKNVHLVGWGEEVTLVPDEPLVPVRFLPKGRNHHCNQEACSLASDGAIAA